MSAQVFLLSPARLDGARARMLFYPVTQFELAVALRTQAGAPIGDVFRFVSGLYFRGKLAYARAFARPPTVPWLGSGALVITQNRGLVPIESRVCLPHLEAFASTAVGPDEPDFTAPLARDAEKLAISLGSTGTAVLLGSIATRKYVDVLVAALGARLLFPSAFVGRGDMSRGGLMLRAAREHAELAYEPVLGATRKGKRPPKLAPTA